MAAELLLPTARATDTNSDPYSGAQWFFYESGTLTPQAVYANATLATSLGATVTADAAGKFVPIYFDASLSYRGICKNASGSVTLHDIDPINTGLLNLLSASAGSANVGFIHSGTGAVARTVQAKLRDTVSVFDFIPLALHADIIAETSPTVIDGDDVTEYIQAALDAHLTVEFPEGLFKISAQLEPRAGQTIIMSPGTTIRQYTESTNIFYAQLKDGITLDCNDAVLYGEGTWSDTWTGSGAHQDRAIRFDGCNNFTIIRPFIRNCGLSGITLWGGTGGKILFPRIEGTHELSTPITSQGNFQMGIYLHGNAPYNSPDDLLVVCPVIYNVAQGFLYEIPLAGEDAIIGIQVVSPLIYSIPGQHAFYLTGGNITITNPRFYDIELAGVKIQTTSESEPNIHGVVVTGINASDVRGNLIEIAQVTGVTTINDVIIQGVGTGIGVGFNCTGNVNRIKADLRLYDCSGQFAVISGSGPDDIDLTINGDECAEDGIVITATSATNIKLRPDLKNVRTDGTDADAAGIFVGSASANVEVFFAKISGSGTNMKHGIASSTAGSTITMHGIPSITGNSAAAILNSGTLLGDLPQGSATYDPGSLADGEGVTTTVTVTHAAVGDEARATFSNALQGISLTSWVSAANTVSVRFQNESGGVLDLASGTLKARVVKW